MTTIPEGKPINLSQLQQELEVAGVATGGGLGTHAPGADEPPGPTTVFLYDAGQPTNFSSGEQSAVEQTIANHVALRDKTDAELAVEFQEPGTSPGRKQDIRDMQSGLMPREQVPM